MNKRDHRQHLFLSLSSALTGYSALDLAATGVAGTYLAELGRKAGRTVTDQLLSIWEELQSAGLDPRQLHGAIHEHILADDLLGPPTRALIKMWYLGQWEPPAGGMAQVVSGEAYVQGLVWDAIDAHPQAAKQEGFGSWAFPPGALAREEGGGHEPA